MPRVWQSSFLWALVSMFLNGCEGLSNKTLWQNNESIQSKIVNACRAHFPDSYKNPSNLGGIALVSVQDTNALCLYGSLRGVDSKRAAIELNNNNSYSYIVVRSSGGPVHTWLSLAEVLVGRVENILVDELCMSSCANYIFPIARYKLVPPGSLVVWHGGPNTPTSTSDKPLSSQSLRLRDYALRTEALYRRLDVNPEILKITSSLSLSVNEEKFIKEYTGAKAIAISGYALPPKVLSRCFGLSGLEKMSHLGNIDKVYKLGRSKSSELNILVLPASYNSKLCSTRP